MAFKGILVFIMYMTITWLADGGINHTIAFVILRSLFRGNKWSFGALVSTSAGISVMFSLTVPLVSFDVNANGKTKPKKLCYILIWLSWPKKCKDAINDTIGFMWCQCLHQWCHMTKKYDVPDFDHLDLRNVMMPLMISWVSCNDCAKGITDEPVIS